MVEGDEEPCWVLNNGAYQENDLELLRTGLLADAQVICGNRTWKVHKAIICTRSKWFKKALLGPFEEGQTGKVTITAFEENEVDCLLHFLYTGKADFRKAYPNLTILVAIFHTWKLADFFCLETLEDLLPKTFDSNATRIARFLCFVDRQQEGIDSVINHELLPAIKVLYQDDLAAVKHKIMDSMLKLVIATMHRLQPREDFRDLFREVPAFAVDWAIAFVRGMDMSFKVSDLEDDAYWCIWCHSAVDKHNAVIDSLDWIFYRQVTCICSNPGCVKRTNCF